MYTFTLYAECLAYVDLKPIVSLSKQKQKTPVQTRTNRSVSNRQQTSMRNIGVSHTVVEEVWTINILKSNRTQSSVIERVKKKEQIEYYKTNIRKKPISEGRLG